MKHDGRENAMDNPIFLANRKAKKLKALLTAKGLSRNSLPSSMRCYLLKSDPDCRRRSVAAGLSARHSGGRELPARAVFWRRSAVEADD
jgi:hypothetical protein